jgi:CDP-diacylglycerol--glycerol-3-phosphate 3-phosphatidyltransferase
VAADQGGKTKTVVQLVALGFLLGAPMVARDFAAWWPGDWSRFIAIVGSIGRTLFLLGTALAVWSGWRYIARNRAMMWSEAGGR